MMKTCGYSKSRAWTQPPAHEAKPLNNRIDRRRHGLEPTDPRGPVSPPPSFLQAFPNFRLFSPNISKESFGGFVGFQGLAIDANRKCHSPNFLRRKGSRGARAPGGPVGLVERHGKSMARILFFRKKNRRTCFAASPKRELIPRLDGNRQMARYRSARRDEALVPRFAA